MSLYTKLAEVYEAMYITFMDYEEEFAFYYGVIDQYKKESILELGCGTGNLAACFINSGIAYFGLEKSKAMLDIVYSKKLSGAFIHGDMRDFALEIRVGACIMTGRTISYLLSNEDVNACFASVYDCLTLDGVFCFDFIDAERFIPSLGMGKRVKHEAEHKGVAYSRESYWLPVLEKGMDFQWESTYYKQEGNKPVEIGRDVSVIRSFTEDEIMLFLESNGFTLKSIMDKPSYAFPCLAIVATKK